MNVSSVSFQGKAKDFYSKRIEDATIRELTRAIDHAHYNKGITPAMAPSEERFLEANPKGCFTPKGKLTKKGREGFDRIYRGPLGVTTKSTLGDFSESMESYIKRKSCDGIAPMTFDIVY